MPDEKTMKNEARKEGAEQAKHAGQEAKKTPAKEDAAMAELTETLKRLQAEFENYRKREEKERKKFEEYAGARLAGKLLPVIDSMESALEKEKNKGLELIYRQLMDILRKEGLSEIECEGKQFDPAYGECLIRGEDKAMEDGAILKVLQKGFRFKDYVLRPAKVKVNRIENPAKTREKISESEGS